MRNRNRNRVGRRRHVAGQKPRGSFQERVQRVGPEHFAIIPVDCGKPVAKCRVGDFYGNILLKPFEVPISRNGLQLACILIEETLQKHRIHDCVCVLETTGRYHRPIQKKLKEHWETRLVHPFTTCLIRRASDLGTKTDDVDLAAIHRAAVDGLAMREEVLDQASQDFRQLTRHRRDLVEKAATLKVQLKESIHAYLPGYTRLWAADSFWESPLPLTIATRFDSPGALQQASPETLRRMVREVGSVIRSDRIRCIQAWAAQAAPADDAAAVHYRRAVSLKDDLRHKQQEIRALELDLAGFLCQSPGVLLLAFAGVGVVSAADYAAELGPITNYATSRSIAGRAGLYPSRWQTSTTDLADGPLVARRNRQLRAALMRMARNLARSNQYFLAQGMAYAQRHPEKDRKVPIARAFSRLSFYLIAGERLFSHAALSNAEKILQKLLEFYQAHQADPAQVTSGMEHAIARLQARSLRAEREVFQQQHRQVQNQRQRPGVRRLGEILPAVLLRIDQCLHQETTPEQTITPTNTQKRSRG